MMPGEHDRDEDRLGDEEPISFEAILLELIDENSEAWLETSRVERRALEAIVREDMAERFAAAAAIEDPELRALALDTLEHDVYMLVRLDQAAVRFVHMDDDEWVSWMEFLEAQPEMWQHVRRGRLEDGAFIPTFDLQGSTGFQCDDEALEAFLAWGWPDDEEG